MGYGLPLQIRSVRLIQHGDVFEEVSPSVQHELESGRCEDWRGIKILSSCASFLKKLQIHQNSF